MTVNALYFFCVQSIVEGAKFKWDVAKVVAKDEPAQAVTVKYYTRTKEWGPFAAPRNGASFYEVKYAGILMVVKLGMDKRLDASCKKNLRRRVKTLTPETDN